jgi:hypothetical protein
LHAASRGVHGAVLPSADTLAIVAQFFHVVSIPAYPEWENLRSANPLMPHHVRLSRL